MSKRSFISSIEEIRKRAREHVENGAVTQGYALDRETVIRALNESLATEIVCTLRYKQHYYQCSGLNAEPIAAEFLEHAQQEQEHADQLAERITQLGGKPNMNPAGVIDRAHADFAETDDIQEMLKENLIAERIAVDTYRELIQFIGDKDPTTRRMLEDILAVEEEHADDLADLMVA